jgi:hypothetical protein
MRRYSLALWCAVATTGAAACTSETPVDEDVDTVDGKADGATTFKEVNSTHSSATFRRYIERALVYLERSTDPIGPLTAKSIRTGRVKVDELADLTCWDFDRVRKDLPAEGLDSSDYFKLQVAGNAPLISISNAIEGYMWSNRVYVARNLPVARLAAVLAHEVNHVINRSEVGYYDNLPTSAFVHEYRAFHVEALIDPATFAGVNLTDYVVDTYELKRSAIAPELLRQPLTERLLPDTAAWNERRVSADPKDIEADCPSNQ